MSSVTVWFIRCAIAYFILAMLLGLHMSVAGPVHPWMPIHVHFNLLGWMSMMIYGVGYHILPRFSGKPLWSEKLSVAQLWMSNVGLVGMAVGWYVRGTDGGTYVLLTFALIEGLSMIFFGLNMVLTIKAAPAPPKPAAK